MELKWRILTAWLVVFWLYRVSSNFSHLSTYREPKKSLPFNNTSVTDEWEQEQQRRKKTLRTFCSRTKEPQNMLKKQVFEDPMLMDHLLVDDNHRALYCYIPKIGCTNWKRILASLRGDIKTASPEDIPHMMIHRMTEKMRLYQANSKDDDVIKKMETYTKFIVVRDPMERLLSAYFDKIHEKSATLDFKADFQMQVLPFVKKLRESAHLKDITLEEFLKFVSSPAGKLNEHWIPYKTLCRPCLLDYDFILKLESIAEDAEKLLRAIGAPANLRYPYKEKRVTTTLAEKHMGNLTTEIIYGVIKDFGNDFLMFGYDLPL